MLWIALHLPLLSLESLAATLCRGADEQPLALVDHHHIASANAAAQALGVKPGLKRATAQALAPNITLGQADADRDAQALLAVAHAALVFTPQVVMPPPAELKAGASSAHAVLLEVRGSLRYFGGLESLLRRLRAAIAPFGHLVNTASAPTPRGAALLARVHRECHCADLPALHRALDAAPVWLLGPGREHWEALQGMGLHTIADLRAMPRSGVSRRFGEALLHDLDQAFGDRPDPREPIVASPTFESRLELFARADTTEQLLHGAGLLLARLVAWLSAQHAFARGFTLEMRHEKRWRADDAGTPEATTLAIALAEPSRDPAHLLVLLRERLAALRLPAPTLELRLHAADVARRPPPNTELFPTPRGEQEGITRLIERLQARLGPEQIQRVAPVADHRPERASQTRPADSLRAPLAPALSPKGRGSHAGGSEKLPASDPAVKVGSEPPAAPSRPPMKAPARATPPKTTPTAATRSAPRVASSAITVPVAARPVRPIWMLEPPRPLAEHHASPMLDGRPLQLLSGPERIEAGWWDGALAERDYFIAQAEDGALVWIYRARLPLSTQAPGWFMQGRFG